MIRQRAEVDADYLYTGNGPQVETVIIMRKHNGRKSSFRNMRKQLQQNNSFVTT